MVPFGKISILARKVNFNNKIEKKKVIIYLFISTSEKPPVSEGI